MADIQITQELIDRYKKVAGATVFSGVSAMGYNPCFMRDVHAFTPGGMMVDRARTLRFIPPRADIIRETHRGEDSPEYQAMASCEPGDVLVIDGMGRKYAAIGGDVKLLQLKMRGAAGLVTDGSIRDLDIVKDYGLMVFAGGRTPMGGAGEIDPFEANVTIGCGGVAVRPNDLIVADDDGVVVVPNEAIEKVIDWVEEHETMEEYVKGLIKKENVAPGKYYPISRETIERYYAEHGR